jgi:hypothetical protein
VGGSSRHCFPPQALLSPHRRHAFTGWATVMYSPIPLSTGRSTIPSGVGSGAVAPNLRGASPGNSRCPGFRVSGPICATKTWSVPYCHGHVGNFSTFLSGRVTWGGRLGDETGSCVRFFSVWSVGSSWRDDFLALAFAQSTGSAFGCKEIRSELWPPVYTSGEGESIPSHRSTIGLI